MAIRDLWEKRFQRRSDPAAPYSQPAISGAVEVLDYLIEERNGVSTYDCLIFVPAGSWIVDALVTGLALWNDGTSASAELGDFTIDQVEIDADGFYTAIDLKALDLLVGQSISFSAPGGVNGVYLVTPGAAGHILNRISAGARYLRFRVTTGAGDGELGRTQLQVHLATPSRRYHVIETS